MIRLKPWLKRYAPLRRCFRIKTKIKQVGIISVWCLPMFLQKIPQLTSLFAVFFFKVIEEPYLKVLYTTEERYTLKRSFYSNKISTSNSAIHPSQYLSITVDAEEKRKLERHMRVRGLLIFYLDTSQFIRELLFLKLNCGDDLIILPFCC